LLAALACVEVLAALAARERDGALPFPAGIFVFPACLVDAREHVLRVRPLADLSSVAARPDGSVVLAFGARRYAFSAGDAAAAERVASDVGAARDKMRAGVDGDAIRLLDPLAPPTVASPLVPDVARTREVPAWERLRVPIGAAAGAALGAGVFFVRDAASDARLLHAAEAKGDVAAYEAYLSRGRRYKDVVEREMLPRAALKVAVAEHTVAAIDAFSRAYPSNAIGKEVADARRAALDAELASAEKTGTFAAVLGYGERYPERRADSSFEHARHALYASALGRYEKELHAAFAPAAEKLVAAAERASPTKAEAGYRGLTVPVVLRHVASKELERADDLVRVSPMYNGKFSSPSTYLDDAHIGPHEKRAAEAIAAALSSAFDPEILAFVPGAHLSAGADDKLPAVKTPTLFVTYRVETSGAAYASKKPRGIFLGLVFFFVADLVDPGVAPVRTKFTFTERIPVSVLRSAPGAAPAGKLETEVYDAMTREAFDELTKRYVAAWLKKPPKKP
ncbi:MAG TPA: hypothetical protein VHB21_21100, partial [Minicystis sp.]|nr:hypothetical protein [Minicystis sp.]